jgi:hypothetical protein
MIGLRGDVPLLSYLHLLSVAPVPAQAVPAARRSATGFSRTSVARRDGGSWHDSGTPRAAEGCGRCGLRENGGDRLVEAPFEAVDDDD